MVIKDVYEFKKKGARHFMSRAFIYLMENIQYFLWKKNFINNMYYAIAGFVVCAYHIGIHMGLIAYVHTMVDNGKEALTAITAGDRAFNLILMDCEMPIMDGYEACEKIRDYEKQQQLTAMPIIALTAHAMSEYRERCMQAGMNEVLTKPVRALTLQQTLQRYSKTIS